MSTSDNNGNDGLFSIANRFVAPGTHFPTVTLADGTAVQTGTVGALLVNIKTYDRLCAGEEVEGAPTKEELERMLTMPIATLARIGMFDIFPAEDWIKGTTSEGRQFVGRKAKDLGH